MAAVGWRLTLEPCADLIAWSLLRAEGSPGARVAAWSGLIEDCSRLRAVAAAAVGGAAPALADPQAEAAVARELGDALLPPALQRELLATRTPPLLTICTRGWLSRVPWDALAVGRDGARLVQTCLVLGGLPPGITAARNTPAAPFRDRGRGVWVVDPGPPEGRWPPLYPSGYPGEVVAMVPATDRLLPDGLGLDQEDLAAELRNAPWDRLVYFGHIGSRSDSPAGAGLVLSCSDGPELLTAHAWLREPERWPAPQRVALLGCASDDTDSPEQTGLVTAAMNAGASVVVATRWALPNRPGAPRLLRAVSAALAEDLVLDPVRSWQCAELASWRATGDPDSSPLYWASPVVYDSALLGSGVGVPA
jgi:hypothetical protein